MRREALSRNHYFIIGLLAGLLLSVYIPQNNWELVQREECPQELAESLLLQKLGEDFEPRLNLINKPLAAKKPVKNVIRPRYYSSELGIREKIFVGVMTTQENINGPATAINRTMAHLVNKIKYFINADNIKTNYKLKNIVGFTDARENLRPFHVIKYIADNYLSDYDYFLIIPDTVYVDVRKLTQTLLQHISVAFDVYMGTTNGGLDATAHHSRRNDDDDDGGGSFAGSVVAGERNYCDLNAGILLSSSVVQKMRNNLDWCVRNGITNMHSINVGRCVKYSSNLASCQESVQGVHQSTYILRTTVRLFTDLHMLAQEASFRNATSVHPIRSPDDFYRLHDFFSRRHLELLQQQSNALEHKSFAIANGTISNKILEIRWPLGVPAANLPETRHDILTWQLLNRTHVFLPNAADIVVMPLTRIDALDLQRVLAPTFEEHTADAVRFIEEYEQVCMRNQDNTFLLMVFLYRFGTESKGKADGSRVAWVSICLPSALSEPRPAGDLMLNSVYGRHELLSLVVADLSLPKLGLDSLVLMATTGATFKADFLNRVRMNTIQGFQVYAPIGFQRYPCPMAHFCKECDTCDVSQATGYFDKFNYDVMAFYSRDYVQARKNTDAVLPIVHSDNDIERLFGLVDSAAAAAAAAGSSSTTPASSNPPTAKSIPLQPSAAPILTILDMFVHSQLHVHILRGVAPNLRYVSPVQQHLKEAETPRHMQVPKCSNLAREGNDRGQPEAAGNELPQRYRQEGDAAAPNAYAHNRPEKCVHLAARKQIGDAIIRYENRSILQK